MRESFRYVLAGKKISREASRKSALKKKLPTYDILAAINDESETDTIHAFKSEKDFEKWAKDAGYEDKVSHLKQKMEEAEERGEDSRYDKEIEDKIRRVTKELHKLSQELKLPSYSHQFIREAQKRRIIDSVMLYEHVDYYGRWIGFSPPGHRDFNRIGFNDIASSLWFAGLFGALCEHPGGGVESSILQDSYGYVG